MAVFRPGSTIQRYFLTEAFDEQFQADAKHGVIFGIFVGIAVFIACLGLFGLAAFTAERRTKEIGIRKTFGASTRDIVLLLLWQFSIPVLLANLIAWPLAYYYLHRWLEGYAYRIVLSPALFRRGRRCGAIDRLGNPICTCPARRSCQPHPCTPL